MYFLLKQRKPVVQDISIRKIHLEREMLYDYTASAIQRDSEIL
jgi:hypothetical protein